MSTIDPTAFGFPNLPNHPEDERRITQIESGVRHLGEKVDRLSQEAREIADTVNSTDPERPGVALRLDRIEQELRAIKSVFQWALGGGIVSLAATAVVLLKILDELKH